MTRLLFAMLLVGCSTFRPAMGPIEVSDAAKECYRKGMTIDQIRNFNGRTVEVVCVEYETKTK